MARFVPNGEATGTFLPDDIYSLSGSKISPDGEVVIIGPNANIYVNNINQSIKTVAINLKEPLTRSVSAIMYYDTGNGLNESEKASSAAFKGDEKIVFAISESAFCKAVRLDINIPYKFSNVTVYDTQPVAVLSETENFWWEYAICIAVSIVVFVLVFLLDAKFKFCDKIVNCIKRNRKNILIGFAAFVLSALLGVAIEFICGSLFGPTSAGERFNVYRYIFICGIVLSVAVFILFARSLKQKPEKLFLVIMLIAGTVMIFASPFGHISWDVESHYSWALNSSYIGPAYVTEADRCVITNQDIYWSKENIVDNKKNIAFTNGCDDYVVEESVGSGTIAHIPSGIFIALARFFNLNFYWRLTLGRVPNLLLYAFAIYLGMKKLKSGKMILAVLAFMPTNLFIATNYSYDYLVNSLSMLGIAYFVSEMQQPDKPISLKDNVVMCGSIALACVPKQIYAPLLLVPFFLRKNNFEKKKRYYTICASAFLVLLLMLAARSLTSVMSLGDVRGGSDVNSMLQVKYIFNNPLIYAKTLLKFLWSYLSIASAEEYICNMAYIGYGFGHGIMVALMIVTAFTDKNKYDSNNKYFCVKAITILMFLGLSALIATAFYISFTGVGYDTIYGCQGRYIMPLLLPVLSVIGSGYVNNTLNRKLYNGLILGCCGMVNLVTIATTMITRLL
ncbi:MAG: DUF2142 domain-containing protein [Clostridia bacterium]|nr:DUF2142 domain-containing protein [Clostridia bacterium]